MKKTWTELWKLAEKMSRRLPNGERNYSEIDSIYKHLFLKHHQNADEILFSRDNRPLEARYRCGDMSDRVETDIQKEWGKAE